MSHPDFGQLPHKDLLSVAQLSTDDIDTIFGCARALKEGRKHYTDVLRHKRLAMIFEKDSLRTRFTFDVGMQDLGGSAVFMDHRDARIGSREALKDVARNLERWVDCVDPAREALKDVARNLERWVDCVVARTYKHRAVVELAESCGIPVINGLTDALHPCQALTDFFTLTEKWGKVAGRRLTYVGDGNNTCHSLLYAAAKLGAHMTVCVPEGYEPNAKVVNEAMITARETGSEIRVVNDVDAGVDGAEAIYTDVWASMGQEDEIEERSAVFAAYQVDEAMMQRAAPNALFMHCLPAHRGAEVTAGVIDDESSVVFDQAENRLHVQKAIMVLLMQEKGA